MAPQSTITLTVRERLARAGRFGPLVALIVPALALFLVFGVFRTGFLLAYLERLRGVPRFLEVLPLGLRFDAMTVALALAPLALVLLVLPGSALVRLRVPIGAYGAGVLGLALLLELVGVGFLDEYDSRPNRLFLEYLHRSPELTGTILTTYPVLLAATVIGTLALAWLAWRVTGTLVSEHRPWSWKRRMLTLPLCAAAMVIAARGGVTSHAANRSTANFSTSHLANELVPNSLYTVACAALDMRMERSPSELYGTLPREEVLERVLRWARIPPEACTHPGLPLLHSPAPAPAVPARTNLVLVLEESLGAQFVGGLGGRGVTPNLEELGRRGLWFTRMYCTGTRTVRGLEATVCGFPPSPSASVVKLGLAQQDFFSVAELLRRQGYATDYVYGGRSEFDNMETFLRSNGFQHSYCQDDFDHPEFVATWGVSDEDLFRRADQVFAAHGDEPFFALVLTTSNHTPFEFPDGKIELVPDASGKLEKATRDNAVKYADHALGEFFRRAREQPYFARTLFVVVADHDTRAPSDDLLPVEHFHIPAMMIGPGVEPRVFGTIASQIDLMPTALHLLGLAPENPMPGRDLLALPSDDPGRALLQYYDVNGFLTGEHLVVHQPYEAPVQFTCRGSVLEPAPLDPELERDALAHVLLPWMLYEEQRYRLQ